MYSSRGILANDLETAVTDASYIAEELRELSIDDGEMLDRLRVALEDIYARIMDRIFPPYPPEPAEEDEIEATDTKAAEPEVIVAPPE